MEINGTEILDIEKLCMRYFAYQYQKKYFQKLLSSNMSMHFKFSIFIWGRLDFPIFKLNWNWPSFALYTKESSSELYLLQNLWIGLLKLEGNETLNFNIVTINFE